MQEKCAGQRELPRVSVHPDHVLNVFVHWSLKGDLIAVIQNHNPSSNPASFSASVFVVVSQHSLPHQRDMTQKSTYHIMPN